MVTNGTIGPYDHDEERHTLRRRAEVLEGSTLAVPGGQAVLRTSIVEETHTHRVACVREDASIERRAVKHGASDPIGESRTVTIRLSRELPVILKETVHVEDVVVATRRVTDVEQMTGTVRQERMKVERTFERTRGERT